MDPRQDQTLQDVDDRVMLSSIARGLFGNKAATAVRAGRFVILERIGAGGMGTVFQAYDPQLDRRVALKVLRSSAEQVDRAAASRIQREALALARLSHPNVVTIHEVGTANDQTFLAMEYVEGEDLASWLQSHPPGSPSRHARALDLLVQAGRGLAAAHHAGFVHRDFKPGNVLVGNDGRARVADFGLVQATGEWSSEVDFEPQPIDDQSSVNPNTARFTQTGTVMGTPRYMPPEQQMGGIVDARSDQFAFCVTAWELLFGTPPWPRRPKPSAPPSRPAGAPRWLVGVLLRGLAEEPEHRYPSMNALLDALSKDPRRRNLRWGLVAGVVVGLGAAGGVLAHRSSTLCDDGPRRIAAVWNDDQRARLDAHVSGLSPTDGAPMWARIENHLDTHAEHWRTTFAEVCDAGRRHNELPGRAFRASMACLDLRHADLQASVEVLEGLETAGLPWALDVTHDLRDPTQCLDPERPGEEFVLPDDPDAATRVLELAQQVTHARFEGLTGDWDGALDRVRQLQSSIEAADYRPLDLQVANLRYTAAISQSRSEDAREIGTRSYWLALRHGDDGMAAVFARRLLDFSLGDDDMETAAQWLEYAQVLGDRARVGDSAVALRLLAHARMLVERDGNLPAARALIERAIELQRGVWGDEHPATIGPRSGLAIVVRRMGQPDAAVALNRENLAISQRAYGDDSLKAANDMDRLATSLSRAGQHEEALAWGQRCVAARLKWLGEDHKKVALALDNLGATASRAGRRSLSLESFEQAMAIYRRITPEDNRSRLHCEHNLASIYRAEGRLDESLELAAHAAQTFERNYGPDHWLTAMGLHGLALTQLIRGELEAAEASARRSADIRTKVWGADHRTTLDSRLALVQIIARARPTDALLMFPELLSAMERNGDPMDHARALRIYSELLIEKHRLDEALEAAREATTLSIPSDALGRAHAALTQAHLARGELAEALAAAEEGLDHTRGSEDQEVIDVLERLRAQVAESKAP
ncbi:MAG: serine/threonine-protein kinase [Deltaproteobacteria bacterium]|nr:serine/threonine-protein kinase [Deltaproteobacteria bacterium]